MAPASVPARVDGSQSVSVEYIQGLAKYPAGIEDVEAVIF
jgi:hypothetical protein